MDRLRRVFFHPRAPLVVAVIAAAWLWTPYLRAAFAERAVREVTVAEAAALVTTPGTAVYDANVREIFLDGHLPGARHVSPLTLAEADLPASRDAALLFYCKSQIGRAHV